MGLKHKRGLEIDRKKFIPAIGEIIYTTDEKNTFIGDGVTAGGNQININTYTWEFFSVINQTEYSPESSEKSLISPESGFYIVFYGSSKLSKNDYLIDVVNNKFILDFTPTTENIEISLYYVGKKE